MSLRSKAVGRLKPLGHLSRCLGGGEMGRGDKLGLTPEYSRASLARSLGSQIREAAFTAALLCCPLVCFHLCQGPQIVMEGILITI